MVGERPMIEHVVEMFSVGDDQYHIVVNNEQVGEDPNLPDYLRSLARRVSVVVVPSHEVGPIYSALQVPGIADDEEVIITYCDLIVSWNYSAFLRHIHGAAGAVPSFRGMHPASYGDTFYAYMQTDGDRMMKLREKRSFTDKRDQEHASVGIYYFRDWSLFCELAERYLANSNQDLSEAYVSLLFNDIVNSGKEVIVHEVDHFICLGTPEDYQQYQAWWHYFNDWQPSDLMRTPPSQGTNLVPMAGAGSRFRKLGYRVAKPLIQVRGDRMVVRAAKSLPPAEKWVFLPRTEDVSRHPIEHTLKETWPECDVVSVDALTSGQAATCLLAADMLEDSEPLLIASADYEQLFSLEAWQEIVDDPTIDGAIWTCRMGGMLMKDPVAFAYCRTAKDRVTVTEVSEKRVISDHPELDPLVIGTFWYRRAGDFKRGANKMIGNGITVNGEYYVGTSINQLLAEGARFVIFDVDYWISFGDPFELQVLEYWEEFFHQAN